MTDLGSLLLKGATETRSATAEGFEPAWLELLASRMEHAAALPEPARELAVKAVTHSLVDGGPSELPFVLAGGRLLPAAEQTFALSWPPNNLFKPTPLRGAA